MKTAKLLLLLLITVLMYLPGCAKQKNGNNNESNTLKVMSFNIRHCTNKDGKLNIPRTAKVITDAGANIVLMQEVDNKTSRAAGKDQTAEIAKITGMEHAFGKAISFGGGEYGVAVLSKFPIVKTENILLPHKSGTEQRTSLWVTVKTGKDTVTVVSAHLESGGSEAKQKIRMLQLQQIKEQILAHPYRLIFGGDLNFNPDSPEFLFIKDFLKMSDKEPYAPTYPGIDPRAKIDYILMYKPERFEVVDYEVIDNELASDHRPIMSTILLK